MEWTDGQAKSSGKRARTHWICGAYPPVFAQGLFFASCGSGGRGSRLVAIRPPSNPAQSPQVEYVLKKNVPYVPTPLPFEDMLFLISDGGIASCLKTATGEVLWRQSVWMAIISLPPSSQTGKYGSFRVKARSGFCRSAVKKWRSSGYRS